MKDLPTGTVTFLFTDIEGSTALLQRLGDRRYAELLAEHQRFLRAAFASGREIDTQGDAFLVAFSSARDALAAAVAAQQALIKHPWLNGASLRVRMGLHTGEPVGTADRYVGLDVHRASRICSVGHGGQILLSQTVADLTTSDLPPGVGMRDLGIHHLKDLREPEHLLQVVHPDLPADFPPLKTLDARPNNLPRQLTSFIGREHAIAEVTRLLSTTALLTLTGAGGCGKTRLALRVAEEQVHQYPHGVAIVELGALSDSALVTSAVATALALPEQSGRPLIDVLKEYLQPRALLLVLDNCEHVVSGCAELAATLLRNSPNLRILSTSREPLNIAGERTWRVPPLSLPDQNWPRSVQDLNRSEAVRLLVDRIATHQPGFAVTENNAGAVAKLCTELDGIPLAIELAAARVKLLTIAQVAERLGDRFRLLTGGGRTALRHHQTLRATMDWSYALLADSERTMFRRLSVFAGGWTLDAAEAICAGEGVTTSEVLDLLTQLADKSLVVVSMSGEEARYGLLTTMRHYAQEKLQETDEAGVVRGRHFDWYLALVECAQPELKGPYEQIWMDRLAEEHDNFRSALEWGAADGARGALLRLSAALGRFWSRRAYVTEGRLWLERALSGSDSANGIRAKALVYAGQLARYQADFKHAAERLRESVERFREVRDTRGVAEATMELGRLAEYRGDHAEAKQHLSEGLALFRELGDAWGIATTVNLLGEVARAEGDYDAARSFYEESLAAARRRGHPSSTAIALGNLGVVALRQGDHQAAKRLLLDSLVLAQKLGDTRNIIVKLAVLAGVAMAEGKPERAGRLLGAAQSIRDATGVVTTPADRAEHERNLASARAALDQETFASSWAEGRAMTLEQAIEYALTEED